MLLFLAICAVAGAIGGLLQGMVGVGTGVTSIPLLTFLLPSYGVSSSIAIRVALATSMAAITLSSMSAVVAHHRHQNIRFDIFKKIVVFSIIGSGVGALIASHLPAKPLQIIFALFMFYTGARLLRKKKTSVIVDSEPVISIRALGLGGFLIGVTASLVGIGGGLFMIPFLRSRHLEMRHAVGTATLAGLPVAIVGTITYIITGWRAVEHAPYSLGYVHWPAFLAISATAMVFAALGAKWVKQLNPLTLQRIFAICIIIVGIKMLV